MSDGLKQLKRLKNKISGKSPKDWDWETLGYVITDPKVITGKATIDSIPTYEFSSSSVANAFHVKSAVANIDKDVVVNISLSASQVTGSGAYNAGDTLLATTSSGKVTFNVKTGFTTNAGSHQYKVSSSSGNLYVDVPVATSSGYGSVKIGYVQPSGEKKYPVQLDANGKMFVAVPWVNSTYSKSSWNYDDTYIKFSSSQSLTEEQKSQARSNIGAGASSFSGSYNDLSNKPTSLPANGGNADTVDGKHASDFQVVGYYPKSFEQSGTIDELFAAVRYTSGAMGSIFLTNKSSGIGSGISGWYNYLYIPHRIGTSAGDNGNFGTIILFPMTESGNSYIFRCTDKKVVEGRVIIDSGNIHSQYVYNALRVNNLTVETAVPANAKFTDTTYNNATQSVAGLMSAADKTKLDGIAAVATSGKYNDLSGKPDLSVYALKNDLSSSLDNLKITIEDYL